jgi:hypothetical protein
MLVERIYSAQETVHLLLRIPFVRTSVTFQTIYTGTNGKYRELELAAQGERELGAVIGEDEISLQMTHSWRK